MSLSDKRTFLNKSTIENGNRINKCGFGYWEDDVKEFIREILSEELGGADLFIKIKTLAGDKLLDANVGVDEA